MLLAIALGACQKQDNGRGAPKAPARVAEAKVSVPASARATEQVAVPLTIDPEPAAGHRPQVVERKDITVNGTPSCFMQVRYRAAVDQPVTWNGERCEALTATFIDDARLKALGRADSLSEETRDDIGRSHGLVFYVEGQFSSAIYPLNSARRVYEVQLGD
jgi:hypothetical protein